MMQAGSPIRIAPKLNAYWIACERPKMVIIPSTTTKYMSTSVRTATKIFEIAFMAMKLNCNT